MWQKIKQLWQKSPTDDITPPPTETSEPVVLMVCSGPVEAAMYVSQLVDAGIPATTMGADSASVFGMQSGLLADVRIIVPAEYAESARELLEIVDVDPDDDEMWADDAEASDSQKNK